MLKHYANFPLWNRKIIWVISLNKQVRLWNFVDLYNEITWFQNPLQSLLFKLIIKLSCPENKKKEKQLKPKVEEPINIDNGKILLIITASCLTVRMLFLGNSPYRTEQFAVQPNENILTKIVQNKLFLQKYWIDTEL